MKDIDEKSKWLISGITSGIGLEIANLILANGGKVVGLVRNIEKCAALKKKYNESLFLYQIDLSRSEDIEKCINNILEIHPEIKIVISNAGVLMKCKADEATYQDIMKLMNTNLVGAMILIKSVLGHIKKVSGRIIQISSVSGEVAFPLWSYYVASKHGINGFCECVAAELEDSSAQMMIVEPGSVNTHAWNICSEESDRFKALVADVDVKKLAAAIIFRIQQKSMPLYLSIGSKSNNQIIRCLEDKINVYKGQQLVSSVANTKRSRRYKVSLPKNVSERSIVCWPVGNYMKDTFNRSDWRDIDNKLICFADSDEEKIGKMLLGRKIVRADELFENKKDYFFIIVSAIYKDEFSKILEDKGRVKNEDFCVIEDLIRGCNE